MEYDFKDFYIEYPGHPRYNSTQLIEDDIIRVILQKIEVMLFTNKGDLLCEPEFGANLLEYLHETRLSSQSVEEELYSQISKYIPELENTSYTLKVSFHEHPEDFQEYMEIYIQISDYNIYAYIT